MPSLNPYSGVWGRKEVAHLLRRTMFGAKPADVTFFMGKTMAQSVDALLTLPTNPPSPPLNNYEDADFNGNPVKDADGIAKGQTWINGTYGDQGGVTNSYRGNSLRSWWFKNLYNQDRSIAEKLVVFWHTHFCTEIRAGGGATAAYRLIELFRTYSYTPLKTLMIEVTKNPQMCHYLNGYLNTKYSPDENYARELQELFGVGKGAGSQYTESDVREAARVLTGHSLNWPNQTYQFYDTLHDTGDKQFSAFYGNKKITGKSGTAGADELTELIDMILATDECAKYIVRRLYRFFVYHEISSAVETDIIEPLAAIYKNNGYNLKPVLEKLFKSEHFYDTSIVVGAMLKSPVDNVIGFMRENDVTPPPSSPIDVHYQWWLEMYYTAAIQGMFLGDPPNVAGYPAYYQSPQFYQIWVNSDTLPKRVAYAAYAVYGGYSTMYSAIKMAEQYSSITDPTAFLTELLENIYPIPVLPGTIQTMKVGILLSGQTQDYYWTNAWNDYKNDPTNATKKQTVETRLQALMYYLTQSSHYQLL